MKLTIMRPTKQMHQDTVLEPRVQVVAMQGLAYLQDETSVSSINLLHHLLPLLVPWAPLVAISMLRKP